MEIASSETRTKYPLSNKKPIKKTVSSSLGLLIGVATIYSMVAIPFNIYFSNTPSTIGTVLMFILVYIVLLISQYFYEVLYFQKYYYDCTSEFVVIRKGVVSTREITIPYERIQDVYVDQDVLDRMFGLYDVHISSATVSSGFEAHIDGVEKDGANGLRQLILSSIKSSHSNHFLLRPHRSSASHHQSRLSLLSHQLHLQALAPLQSL
jgi:membrane protein YdbS with pleckstrin-like domain